MSVKAQIALWLGAPVEALWPHEVHRRVFAAKCASVANWHEPGRLVERFQVAESLFAVSDFLSGRTGKGRIAT